MCGETERAVIGGMLAELGLAPRGRGRVVLRVHQGVMRHIKVMPEWTVPLCPGEACPGEEASRHFQLGRLSAGLGARLQRLVAAHVGDYGKLSVRYSAGQVRWRYVKFRR